ARLLPPGPAVAPRVLADPAAPRAVAQRVLRGAGAVRRRGAPRKPRPPSAGGTAGGRGRRRDRGPAVDRAGVGGGVARPRRRVRRARRTAVPGVARLPADLPDRAGVPAPEPAAVRGGFPGATGGRRDRDAGGDPDGLAVRCTGQWTSPARNDVGTGSSNRSNVTSSARASPPSLPSRRGGSTTPLDSWRGRRERAEQGRRQPSHPRRWQRATTTSRTQVCVSAV